MTFADDVERWRSLVDDEGCAMGTDFVLAFIEHESGGNWCSMGMRFPDGSTREAGIGQLDFGDDPDGSVFGADRATLREGCAGGRTTVAFDVLSDDAKQQNVHSVCAQIDHFLDVSRGELASIDADWNSLDVGRLVKMQHNLPGIARTFLPKFVTDNGRPPIDWDDWKLYVLGPQGSSDGRVRNAFQNAESVAARAGLDSDTPLGSPGLGGGEFLIPALAIVVALTRGAS